MVEQTQHESDILNTCDKSSKCANAEYPKQGRRNFKKYHIIHESTYKIKAKLSVYL